MLLIQPNAAFSCSKCAHSTTALMSPICTVTVNWTTWMNASTQSTNLCRSLYLVGITTAYSSASGWNTNCWVILHKSETVNTILPASGYSENWRICYGWVQLKYNNGNEGFHSRKVFLRSLSLLCIYWNLTFWASDNIALLALAKSTLQSTSRHQIEVVLHNLWL